MNPYWEANGMCDSMKTIMVANGKQKLTKRNMGRASFQVKCTQRMNKKMPVVGEAPSKHEYRCVLSSLDLRTSRARTVGEREAREAKDITSKSRSSHITSVSIT